MVVDGAQTGHHDIADRIRPLMQRANVDRIYYCHGFVSHFDRALLHNSRLRRDFPFPL
jgi:hypothetical protein